MRGLRGVWVLLVVGLVWCGGVAAASGLGLGLAAAVAPAVAAGPFTISGVVTNSVNGEPVPFAHLSLGPANTRVARAGRRLRGEAGLGVDLGVDADRHGRFELVAPGPGSWQMTAEARGFRAQSYEQHENYSSSVVLSATMPSIRLNFRLVPDAEVSGFAVDEAGEAVRAAQVTLVGAPTPDSGGTEVQAQVRSATTTDDRGHFELASVGPGSYRMCVLAQPWYASAAAGNPASSGSGNPALDVVFPPTWFPGVSDQGSAETLNLRPGEVRQVSFRLLPVPASHLRLVSAAPETGGEGRRLGGMPPVQVQPVSAELGMQTSSVGPDGQVEMSGFGPGLYMVRSQQPDGTESVRYLRVTEGGNSRVDLSGGTAAAEVRIKFEGGSAGQGLDVSLLDPVTGDVFRSNSGRGGGGMGRRARGGTVAAQPGAGRAETELQAPPGEYNLVLSGARETVLTGISVGAGAVQASRRVRVGAGTNLLTVHVAEGRGLLSGGVSAGGKAAVGAMVLLVPTSFGERGSIATVGRDQSNTDGSFEIEDIVPGQYILLAIDHGWEVNWRDPRTLQRYLLGGVPILVRGSGQMRQDLVAMVP